MSVISGWIKTHAYRKTADGYKKESRDTSSQTVYMDSGSTLQSQLGAVTGVTTSLASTSNTTALAASAGTNLQGQIDTINSNLGTKANKAWTLIGTGTSVDIRSVYASAYEYLVVFKDSHSLCTTFLIPYQALGYIYYSGYYYSSKYYATIAVSALKNAISINNSWTNILYDSTTTNTGTIFVYYR